MKYFIANWKMQLDSQDSTALAKQVDKGISPKKDQLVVVCPQFTELPAVNNVIKKSKIVLGAQDVSAHTSGAYTGEVSALNLKQHGCKYVIVGHSERRRLLHETDELISAKLQAALDNELIPILCVGESSQSRQAGQHEDKIKQQLQAALEGLDVEEQSQLIVAYEPLWAIGTGKAITPQQAEQMHAFIKRTLLEILPSELATQTPIVYGGSVDVNNSTDILLQPTVDGLLIGGASLDAEQFISIIKNSK